MRILQIPVCSKIFTVCVLLVCSVSFRSPLHRSRSAWQPRALLTCTVLICAVTVQLPQGRAWICCFKNTLLLTWILLSGRANYSNPRYLFRHLNMSVLGTGAVLLLTYIFYKTFHMRQFVQTSSCPASEFSSGFPESPTGKVPTSLSCDSLATVLLAAVLAFQWTFVLHSTFHSISCSFVKGHRNVGAPASCVSSFTPCLK